MLFCPSASDNPFTLGARFPFWCAVFALHSSAGLRADYGGSAARANMLMLHSHGLAILHAKLVSASIAMLDFATVHLALDSPIAERTRIYE